MAVLMTEVWVAAIAVLGTLAGASVSPIVIALSKSRKRKSKDEAKRLSCLTAFVLGLLDLATKPASAYTGPEYRNARDRALAARVEFTQHLSSGDARVDAYTFHALEQMDSQKNVTYRIKMANHAARRLFEWQRGDLSTNKLTPFVLSSQEEFGERVIVEEEHWSILLEDPR